MPAALDGFRPFKILNFFSGDVSLKVENSNLLTLGIVRVGCNFRLGKNIRRKR